MAKQLKRSKEPLFWELFIAGGMWAAIFAPAVIIIVGFIIPFADPATLTHLLRLSQTLLFKVFILLMMVLPIWYGLYRILHTLHDIKIYPKRGALLFYGLALVWSAHAGYVVFIMGNS